MTPSSATARLALAAAVALSRPTGAVAGDATCAAPISAQCATSGTASSHADPHLRFAHGGRADFRGVDGTHYALLSAPGVSFAAETRDTDFLLPKPLLVHGSFFTRASWVLRDTADGTAYGVASSASEVGFEVYALRQPAPVLVSANRGVWTEWARGRLRAYYKQATLFVRANGWEMNVTRQPIYNPVRGPSRWRLDIAMRVLGGHTGLEAKHGTASETCFAHGLIGQSFDRDDVAVDGAMDEYATAADGVAAVTTRAQAEGAIEGVAADYALDGRFGTAFRYARYNAAPWQLCAHRNVTALGGRKSHRAAIAGGAGAGVRRA